MSDIQDPSPPPTPVPNNVEAERGLLGSVLIMPDLFYELADLVRADDFYIHRHRWLWEVIGDLLDEKKAVDPLTITDALQRRNQLDDFGGGAYVAQLMTSTASALHAESYARIVAEMAARRRLLEAANAVARAAYDLDMSLDEVLSTAESSVLDVAVTSNTMQRDAIPAGDIASEIYDSIAAASQEKDPRPPGLATGFIDFDELLGGLRPADLLVLAARPGKGKTSFLVALADYIAIELKKRVAVFSVEMDAEILVKRLISRRSHIPLKRIRDERLQDTDWAPFTAAVEAISNESSLLIDDTPGLLATRLRTQCRRIKAKGGLDLVIIDYLQLMSAGWSKRFSNRQEEVTYISRQLKILARELRVPVLAAAQLSRAVEQRQDKKPILSDLRESGAIEQDSDIVMFLHSPELQGVTQLIVAKHRNGPTGVIDLIFQKERSTFENAVRRTVKL